MKSLHLPTRSVKDLVAWIIGPTARRFLFLGVASAALAYVEILRFALLPSVAEAMQPGSDQDPWRLALIAFAVFCILHPILLGIAAYLRNEWINIHTRNSVILATFRRALGRSFRDYAASVPGMTASYVSGYAQTLLGFTRIPYVDTIYFITTLVAISAFFAEMDPSLFLPILFWLAALVIIGAVFYRGASGEAEASMAAQGGWFGAQTETFTNWALVKGAHSEEQEFAAFRSKLLDAAEPEQRVQRRLRRLMVCVAVVNGVTLSLMIWVALTAWSEGTLNVASLLFILPISLKIVSLSEAALGISNEFIVLLGQISGSTSFLKFDEPAPAAQVPDAPQGANAVAELTDVTLSVPPDTVLLAGFDLTIGRGEVVALTGPSGAGKSTLMHSLAGLYGIAAGTLRLAQRDSRPSVALCAQKTTVFNRSLRDNLLYGAPSDAVEDLPQAIRIAGLQSVVEELGKGDLDAGLDHIIAPEGANLSGGQLQRVSIARALVKRPALLLLDEATTGIESQMEAQIMRDIRSAYPEMAVMIVSHNPETLLLADRTVSLKGDEARGGLSDDAAPS